VYEKRKNSIEPIAVNLISITRYLGRVEWNSLQLGKQKSREVDLRVDRPVGRSCLIESTRCWIDVFLRSRIDRWVASCARMIPVNYPVVTNDTLPYSEYLFPGP